MKRKHNLVSSLKVHSPFTKLRTKTKNGLKFCKKEKFIKCCVVCTEAQEGCKAQWILVVLAWLCTV